MDSNVRGVYAFPRQDQRQTLLVTINLDDDPACDYGLTLDMSDLDFSGGSLIFGHGKITMPIVHGAGGFEDYAPKPMLAAQSLLVIEFSNEQ